MLIGLFVGAVGQHEQLQLADQMRAQELAHERLVAIIGPDVAQHRAPVLVAGDAGEPFAILVGRRDADALDVLHHREAERVGVEAGIAAVVVIELRDDAGMAVQNLHQRAFADPALDHRAC